MKIFYSSDFSQMKFNKTLSIVFVFLMLALLGGGAYLVFLILRAIFLRSFLLGLIFLFFVLPGFARLLFVMFFGVFSSLLSVFLSKKSKNTGYQTSKDEPIDVKYKILK